MDVFMTVFRVLHIVGGTFWVGAAMFATWFLSPAAGASGPAGGIVMGNLLGKTKFMVAIAHASTWTIISGIALIWKGSNRFDPEWMMSSTGMIFSAGGAAGIAAWAIGLAAVRPTALRIVAIAKAAEAAGGAPTPEQQVELGALGGVMRSAGKAQAALALAALVAMAAARHIYI